MSNRLTRKDLISIGIAVVVTVGAIFFLKDNSKKAFPEISLKFSIDRNDAASKAEAFLEDFGYDLSGYHKATVFSSEYLPRLYIDKELGPEYLKVYADSGVKLWFWTTRFFKPLQKLEYYVDFDPVTGELKGFERELEDEAEGAELAPDSAMKVALRFLTEYAKFDSAQWRLVSSNAIRRPKRLDYEFVWERKGFKVKDATYRMRVVVQGDEVGAWEQFLKVPEAWKRDYRKIRSYNSLFQNITNAIFMLMVLGMLYVLITRWKKRLINWKVGLFAGGFIAVITFITKLNQLPLDIAYYYDTMSSLTAFYTKEVINFLLSALLTGVITLLAFASGETLYREALPKKLHLKNFFSLKGFYTKEGFMGVLFGYMAAVWFMVWVTAFYLIGKKFGFWTPADIEYSNIVNSYLPWLFALAAFLPAMMEESIFRLFGVPFFKKLTNSIVLALIIPAFIWGFLHSAYPVEPGYARGLEVGIGGIFFGILMLKLGILSTIVLHYAVDAFFFAYYLFVSKSVYLKIAAAIGVGIFAIPFVISLIRYIKRGEFEPSEPLTNESNMPEAVEEETVVFEAERPEFPRIPKWKLTGIAAFVIGIVLLAVFRPYRLGRNLKVKFSPRNVVELSEDTLRARGYDLEGYRGLAVFEMEQWDTQEVYIRLHGGFAAVDSFFKVYRPSGMWKVRWFKPLETEEYRMNLSEFSGKASLYSFEHVLPETASGANLALDSARVLAANYLKSKGFELSEFRLYKSESDKKEHRTDFEFGWESLQPFAGEAKVRLDVAVRGDEPQGPYVYLKVPEKWVRNFYKKTAWDSVRYFLNKLLTILFVAMAVFFIVKGLLKNRLDYRAGARYLLVAVFFALILPVYSVWHGVVLKYYHTAMPYSNFTATLISSMISTKFGLLAVIFIVAYLAAYRRHRVKPIDAAVAFGLGVLILGLLSFFEWLRLKLGMVVTSLPSVDTTPIWERLPFVSSLNRWLSVDLMKLGAAFVVFGWVVSVESSKRWLRLFGILLLLALLKATQVSVMSEALGFLLFGFLGYGVLFFVWEYLLKRDFALSMVLILTISVLPLVLGVASMAPGRTIYGILSIIAGGLLTGFMIF